MDGTESCYLAVPTPEVRILSLPVHWMVTTVGSSIEFYLVKQVNEIDSAMLDQI